jgi:hypothetical protein
VRDLITAVLICRALLTELESVSPMISKKTLPYILGAPLAIGIIATPLLATTESPADVGRSFVDTTNIELLYPQFAQVGGNDIGGGDQESGGENRPRNRVVNSGPPVEATETQTTVIIRELDRNERLCDAIGDEYTISCFAKTYRELADDIPANGDYAEARETLLNTARELDNLVRRNIDRQKPTVTARMTTSTGQTVRTPRIAAVRADRAPQLKQQAADILEEAETVLLRSASSDATRAIHFQRIAAAVGSNKVLLRSS